MQDGESQGICAALAQRPGLGQHQSPRVVEEPLRGPEGQGTGSPRTEGWPDQFLRASPPTVGIHFNGLPCAPVRWFCLSICVLSGALPWLCPWLHLFIAATSCTNVLALFELPHFKWPAAGLEGAGLSLQTGHHSWHAPIHFQNVWLSSLAVIKCT